MSESQLCLCTMEEHWHHFLGSKYNKKSCTTFGHLTLQPALSATRYTVIYSAWLAHQFSSTQLNMLPTFRRFPFHSRLMRNSLERLLSLRKSIDLQSRLQKNTRLKLCCKTWCVFVRSTLPVGRQAQGDVEVVWESRTISSLAANLGELLISFVTS